MTHAEHTRRTEEPRPLDAVIAGGGPAGLMLGVLLARRGLRVEVLEKHGDFLRDFRGDTVHPSTMRTLDELGWLEEFLELPHERMRRVRVRAGGRDVVVADMGRLPVPAPFIAFMPQWDVLNFLAGKGERLPGFRLRRSTRVQGLLRRSDGRILGVQAHGPDGAVRIRAKLVVGADGRWSTVREAAGLSLRSWPSPLDLLWFRVPAGAERPPLITLGEDLVIAIDRGEYLQAAQAVPAGSFELVRAGGVAAWRERVARSVPQLAAGLAELGWDRVHPLQVRVDRLRRWHAPGLLCIGDAAHAMSPVGGVGVNLAVQDAVAADRLLGPGLARGCCPGEAVLHRVQRRREPPTAVLQAWQLAVMRAYGLRDRRAVRRTPPPLRVLAAAPGLARLGGRLLGLGLRPEPLGRL